MKKSISLSILGKHDGFTLSEIVISIFCLMILGLGAASLSQMATRGSIQGQATLASLEQRSEIRDLLLVAPKNGGSSCVSRLGLSGTEVFTPGVNFIFNNLQYENHDKNVNMGTVSLSNASYVGMEGTSSIYSAQLIMSSQSTQIGSTVNPLRDSILGSMNITVDSQGHIIACNWDQVSSSALTTCSQTQGMVLSGGKCLPLPSLPIYGVCPTSTVLDATISHCIPSNVKCGSSYVSTSFDGNSLSCTSIPTNYGIRYPASYQAPNTTTNNTTTTPAPQTGSTPSSGSSSSSTTSNSTVASLTCTCGTSTLLAGSSEFCVQASKINEGFGNYDDLFDVKICNSQGVLQDATPAHYYEEHGIGTKWTWRIAQCTNYGGTKVHNGTWYNTGKCW